MNLHWIKCTDYLPQVENYCWVAIKKKVLPSFYREGKFYGNKGEAIDGVTHWSFLVIPHPPAIDGAQNKYYKTGEN